MINYFTNISPLFLAVLGGIVAFIFSILGSGIVLFFKTINKKIMNFMIALSAGVMLSASFFSLLNPAIEISNTIYSNPIFIVS